MTAILEIRGLKTHFFTRAGVVKAVDGVDFSVARGEIMGLVGESGSGKSVTGFSIPGLIDPPGRIVAGVILFNGEDIAHASEKRLQSLRGNRIAMIFQDPMMTLNPVLSVGTQLVEAVLAHERIPRQTAWERSRDALGLVGIPSPDERLHAYPHQLSGGMQQRVAIATAFLNRPELIIADEPTTALDVTIQAQIIFETQGLIRQTGTSLIWITHDLAVVAGLADRISVMYAGRIVEQGKTDDVLDRPLHPYTVGLLASLPTASKRGERLNQIEGIVPNMLAMPKGCAFGPRCRSRTEVCASEPPLDEVMQRQLRCFNPQTKLEENAK